MDLISAGCGLAGFYNWDFRIVIRSIIQDFLL